MDTALQDQANYEAMAEEHNRRSAVDHLADIARQVELDRMAEDRPPAFGMSANEFLRRNPNALSRMRDDEFLQRNPNALIRIREDESRRRRVRPATVHGSETEGRDLAEEVGRWVAWRSPEEEMARVNEKWEGRGKPQRFAYVTRLDGDHVELVCGHRIRQTTVKMELGNVILCAACTWMNRQEDIPLEEFSKEMRKERRRAEGKRRRRMNLNHKPNQDEDS